MLVNNTPNASTPTVKSYKYKGHKYWITVESAKHDSTGDIVFLAYKSNEQPGWLHYGSLIKELNGNVIIAKEKLIAFTLANTAVRAEIDNS